MAEHETKLAVVGAGPGGYAAAFFAADLGMDVTLIDPAKNPGGVCLYRGCIPSKALLHVARVIREAAAAEEWGVRFAEPEIDPAQVKKWKDGVVRKLTGGLGQLAKVRKVRRIRGKGKFLDARTLEVGRKDGGTDRLAFEHAIVATGSRPATLPGLPDSPRVMDSTAALRLESVPASLLVVGGGYIGLELGSVYAALGTKVTVVEMLPGLLPGADRDLVAVLAKRLRGEFESILLDTTVKKMTEETDGIRVRFEGKDAPGERVFEKVLVSVGRKPNSGGIGLENTKAEIDDRGFVRVDGQRRTTESSIFAIGDVAGEPMLAHKASHEGRVAVEAAAGKKAVFEPQAIPAVVFTDPEIAWCGLTEEAAEKEGRKVRVAKFPWAASGRAATLGRSDGLTKLIVDPESERLLGAGIAGPGAGELISELVLAIEMGAAAPDVRLTIHPHPTLSETVMEAAEGLFNQSTHYHRSRIL
ncbi:MAG: dihydrolipoyl dehydrogenase [Planctomycetota bacterium]|jgi:dihydrolipoamide dehydrogenase